METLKLKNKEIDYFKFGHGEKTFVIIPGLSVKSVMESERSIIKNYRKFSDEYTVYCFDRRKEVNENYSLYDMADDCIDAFNALGLKDICIFGASQGGMIAMLIAIKCDLIKKAVFGSTSPVINEKALNTLKGWAKLAKEKKREELFLSIASAMFTDEACGKIKEIMKLTAKTVTEAELERFSICAGATVKFDIRDKLKDIKCETLFISDKTDKLFGDISDMINNLKLDKAETVTLNRYGHAAYDIAPNYKEIIYKFFEKA